jgi:sugar-specific transcriptional regulator TrmB
MADTTFLENLKKLGLNDYEARGYLALMERSSLTATQISAVSGVPRTKVYDVTESLMKKGLCSLVPGKINKYRAFEVSAAAENLLRENEAVFNMRKEQIQEASESLKQQLSIVYGDNAYSVDPLEYIEIIKDPYQFHKRFMQLADEAKEEMLAFTKPPYTGPKQRLTEQTEQQAQLLRRGLKIRVIYEIPQDKEEFEWWFQDIDANVKYGEEARVIKELPMKMVIFDSRIVLFALEDPTSKQPSLTAQVIEHAALAKSLKITFETFWERAEDYHILRD